MPRGFYACVGLFRPPIGLFLSCFVRDIKPAGFLKTANWQWPDLRLETPNSRLQTWVSSLESRVSSRWQKTSAHIYDLDFWTWDVQCTMYTLNLFVQYCVANVLHRVDSWYFDSQFSMIYIRQKTKDVKKDSCMHVYCICMSTSDQKS